MKNDCTDVVNVCVMLYQQVNTTCSSDVPKSTSCLISRGTCSAPKNQHVQPHFIASKKKMYFQYRFKNSSAVRNRFIGWLAYAKK